MSISSINILYTSFSERLPGNIWNKYFNLLPDRMKEKNIRFQRWQDRHSHLFGQLLLLVNLKEFGYGKGSLEQVLYEPNGRPYLNADIDFNISHSGGEVLCAMTKGMRIGIDVEEIKKIHFQDFKNVMNPSQWRTINNATEPLGAFFKLWTIKESVIKADGRGLAIPLPDINIAENIAEYDNCIWYLSEIQTQSNSSAYLATSNKEVKIYFRCLDFYPRSLHLQR
ncbi:4'-phosphopantetheinyl transferase family protein [Aquimarina spongiae]|uniref:4'-phosphopantetheinyl transferase n=1 Tax=Aquimarina spongiae TaxID=570521 RepID=A0A1M6H0X1_9FLAO|nr:4'-phosphopantetheinyl transferase superfamily protein [Aquimarina spongiae]SHJ15848.1 4'-phosphopantetheinyl transferase [Aquimarina spongiae]